MGTAPVSGVTATTFTILNGNANRDFTFSGTGFVYNSQTNKFTAGTITSILETTHDASHTQLASFDLNVLAADWMNAVIDKANDGRVIESLVSPWTFNFIGNAGADGSGASSQNDIFTGNGGNDNFAGLTRLGAVVIGFDIVFAEPDRLNPDVAADTIRNLDEETRAIWRM